MMRAAWRGPALLLGFVAGFGGCGSPKDVAGPRASEAVIDAALLAKAWPVRLSSDAERAPFEADPGWTHIFERRYPLALMEFNRSGNAAGRARVHQELAAVYRQGALIAANATHHVYGADRAPTDPLALQYIVGVSRAMRGDAAAAQVALAEATLVPAVAAQAAAWSTWLEGGHIWPPDRAWLEARTGPMGPVDPTTQPLLMAMPHHQLEERTAQGATVDANDPTALLALSEWHLAAARKAAGKGAADLPLLMNTWRLPVESAVTGSLGAGADAWLFGRGALCPEDLSFLADVDASGPGAVSAWADRSPLAAALAPAWDGSKLNHEKVLDQSVLLMRQAQVAMVQATGGEAGFHRPFALFVRLGVLRAGMQVADKAGQYRDAGILRLEALERMEGGKGSVQRDPAFALSVAAWDAGNRSPLRPEDILHNLVTDFPALAAARTPLEALHLRLNRHAAPSTPVH